MIYSRKFFKPLFTLSAITAIVAAPLTATAASPPDTLEEVSSAIVPSTSSLLSQEEPQIGESEVQRSTAGPTVVQLRSLRASHEGVTVAGGKTSDEVPGVMMSPKVAAPEEIVDDPETEVYTNFGELIEDSEGIYFVDGIEASEPDGPMMRITFLQDMTNKVRSLGGTDAIVKTANIVCDMSSAIGCASFPSTITFANRLSGYSNSDKWAVAAHELGHIRHFAQWSQVNNHATYKSLFRSSPEHLADCMARSVGRVKASTRSCTSAQLTFAKQVWNKQFVPKPAPTPTPDKSPIKAGDFVAVDSNGNLWNYGNKAKSNPARVKIGHGWNAMTSINSGDFSGDGIIDIVASDKSGKLWLYSGKRAGGFAAKKQIGHGWQNLEIKLAKMTKTSKYADVLAITKDGRLLHYPSTGGGFKAPRQIGFGWQGFDAVNWGYFDGDNNIDAIAQQKDGKLRLYRTNGSSFIGETRKQIGSGWTNLKSATVNGAHGTNSTGFIAQNNAGKLMYYPMNSSGAWGPRKDITTGFPPESYWFANSPSPFSTTK